MSEHGIKDGSGRPLRLFQLDGRPVTDRRGVPLLNICGHPLVTKVPTKSGTMYCDVKGAPLCDSCGRSQEDDGFSPTEGPPELERRSCCGLVFALDGHPLTDSAGVPLASALGRPLVVFSPKGRPVTDLEGRDVTDPTGLVLHPEERPYLAKDKRPLRIFDELGRPLTDENGFPFTDILGFPLIVNDEFRNPVSTMNGFPLKDADGFYPWDEGYDLTKEPKHNVIHKAIVCKNKENGIAFDAFGHPLTDMYGFPLFDIEGNPLVKRSRKMWVDIHKNPVIIIKKRLYDEDALRYLKNSKGSAVRLYDRRAYPLTDHEGMPLMNANGLLLLRFSENGEPTTDTWGYPIYDSRGNPIGSSAFRPCKDFLINPARDEALKFKRTGMQYFDVHGMPITNIEGIPLVNAYQELMVKYDENFNMYQDSSGRNIFDILGLPVGCSLNKPLKGPTGEPIRLYNKLGKPLTDKDGNVLKSVMNEFSIKTNEIGRVESDSKGFPFYDAEGCPMGLPKQFLPTKAPSNEIWVKGLRNLDGSPLIMYDMSGEPLTDDSGRILFDNSGVPLITISSAGFIQERNGDFILDTDGYTNFKIAGRAIDEKIAIFDKHDRPLIGPSRFILRLRTGREIVIFDSHGFPVSTVDKEKIYDSQGKEIFTPLSDIYSVPNYEKIMVLEGKLQLFDSEDRPLLDITGEILHSSKGVPLLNLDEHGFVRSDALGRPVFDPRGIPVCNPGGLWQDQRGRPLRLYDDDCYPVTDARGKELLDIEGRPLLTRGPFGHPLYDLAGKVLCDAEGRRLTSESFRGTAAPPHRRTSSLMESKEVPLRLFDCDGRPLTDDCGKPLETSKGKPILDLTKGLNRITDLRGRTVFDARSLPLGCSANSPILTCKGEPVVLYTKEGNPLMTTEGMPIRKADGSTLLDFDQFGRPDYDHGSGLYDLQGKPVGSPECVLSATRTDSAPLMSLEGKPVKVFDRSGLPLTDDKGNALLRADGEPLKAGSWGDNLG